MIQLPTLYFDWNIFDKIEKIDRLPDNEKEEYQFLKDIILTKQAIIPYSNAHINDLLRGFKKNPEFTQKHIDNIKFVTNDLLIIQYWGRETVTWHNRDASEFFKECAEELETDYDSVEDLLVHDDTGILKTVFKSIGNMELPEGFSSMYELDPIFGRIFPNCKSNPTMLSLMNDILAMSSNSKKDYSLYRSLRNFSNTAITKLNKQSELIKQMQAILPEDLPRVSQMTSDDFFKESEKNNPSKTSKNGHYDKIISTFQRIDWRGYKSDKIFQNMFDDALHTFYAAHCEYFFTIDDNCYYKATETYKELGISTKVVKPNEFLSLIRSYLNDNNSQI